MPVLGINRRERFNCPNILCHDKYFVHITVDYKLQSHYGIDDATVELMDSPRVLYGSISFQEQIVDMPKLYVKASNLNICPGTGDPFSSADLARWLLEAPV
ncbi:hypothetical protein V8E54_011588 [Elaphomyces granulatus]